VQLAFEQGAEQLVLPQALDQALAIAQLETWRQPCTRTMVSKRS
jgi:hypothetical protein